MITTLCTTIKSRCTMAWNTNLPKPGKKNNSLNDDRARQQEGNCIPTMVSTGTSALGNA